MGNSFGKLFRITTYGESHGPALGVVIDGCPAGLVLDEKLIEHELGRRRPGQSKLVTQRQEKDEFEILSGVFEGVTTGTPISILIRNTDAKSKDYSEIRHSFRPGHADFTYFAKYRHRDYRGGGRSSARETAARVAAGAIAKQLLSTINVKFVGGLIQLGEVQASQRIWDQVETNDLRCVDPAAFPEMFNVLEDARKNRDSVGGVVEVVATGVPVGLGEPVFGRLDAAIAGAMMSIPAVKGVEIGAGFAGSKLKGSQLNDEMYADGFASNHHGGILGGISSGAPIVVRIALKPTSSIPQEKKTLNEDFSEVSITTKGRHDPCVAIRAVPIAESMLALVLVDYWLQDLAQQTSRQNFSPIQPINYDLRK